MENIIDIYNLLSEEITETIEKLTDALDIIKNRKNTNARFVDNIKERKVCPHYQSINIIKKGHDKNKIQTYQCKDCRKKFNDCSATLVAHIKLTNVPSNNVYNNTSGIDFGSVYADYNYLPLTI